MNRGTFLGTAAAAAAMVPRAVLAASREVSVAYAGSLVTPMEHAIGPAFAATGYTYRGEGKGSTALANLIRDGLRVPDVFISADTTAIESLRGAAAHDAARWYATFAATRIQIAYSPTGRHAADFAAAARGERPWYDVLTLPDVVVARTDPEQDPKGYRVLIVMRLAERFYRRPGLARRVLGDDRNPRQVLPEEDALARLATGEVDALWAYSTESVSRGLPFIDLPAAIGLGDPAYARQYAEVSVDVGTKTYAGAPSVYALTIPTYATNPDGGAAFVIFLLGPQGKALLARAGLTLVAPDIVGDRTAIASPLERVLSDA